MAMNLAGSKNLPTPNVNVTPLVDVALVVLIIFMVVTPLVTKTFWINLPEKDDQREERSSPAPNDEPLVLTVDKEGVIRINKTVLAKHELKVRLSRMLAAQRRKVLYFDAHGDLAYGKAVEVMDLSRGAGAGSIAILTRPVVE